MTIVSQTHINSPIARPGPVTLAALGLLAVVAWAGAAWSVFWSSFCIGAACDGAGVAWWAWLAVGGAITSTAGAATRLPGLAAAGTAIALATAAAVTIA